MSVPPDKLPLAFQQPPAQRFKVLDAETNIPIPKLDELTDNSSWVSKELDSLNVESMSDIPSEVLDAINSGLDSLQNIGESMSSEIQGAVDSAMKMVSSIKLPDIAKNALDALKNFDLGGLKGFIKDIAGIGKALLCSNLDFLKLFLLGFGLTRNILSGLLIGLLLSWLDRICSPDMSPDFRDNNPSRDVLDTVFPYEPDYNSDNVFSSFKNYCSDFMDFVTPSASLPAFNQDDFITNGLQCTGSEFDTSFQSLAEREFNATQKTGFLESISNRLGSYSETSSEYGRLLTMRGRVSELPPVSYNRSIKQHAYSNLPDKLGSFMKKLPSIDIKPSFMTNMSGHDKTLFDKLVTFKNDLARNNPTRGRTYQTGSYDDMDFNSHLPNFSNEEKEYLRCMPKESDSHMWRDMSPTAEVVYV